MTITEEQIENLKYEAGCYGDREMVAICDAALDGDEDARAECVRVILDAAAQVEGFGPVISVYTRREAIDDGVLVDVDALHPTMRSEVGIRFAVAMTRRVYADIVDVHPRAARACCDLDGRLWDLLWMMSFAIRRGQGSEVAVRLLAVLPEGRGVKASEVTLRAVCGPGDNAEPVITVMYPDED